jgi:DNA-binding beta-propeller fold protein YncE
VVAIGETTFKITARMPGGTYPDGIAYAPQGHKLYVSDEHAALTRSLTFATILESPPSKLVGK